LREQVVERLHQTQRIYSCCIQLLIQQAAEVRQLAVQPLGRVGQRIAGEAWTLHGNLESRI
jgi:hypothetical protein